MNSFQGSKKTLQYALVFAVLTFAGISAYAQDKAAIVPDAQVEANVLKALAGAPQLADQSITTNTVFGTVTLSGVVRDESLRVMAENLASRAAGVQKVVDELTLGNPASASPAPSQTDNSNGTNPVLQSDGTYTQAPAQTQQSQQQQASPPQDGQASQQQPPVNLGPYRRPYSRQPYPQQNLNYNANAAYGAQQGGESIVIPTGTMLRIRINQGLDSKHSAVGNTFDGVVVNDVVAAGSIAVPRGATVQGTIVDSKTAGAFGGRGQLGLQITQITLAGKTFGVVTDTWSQNGPDKTIRTVNNTVGLSAVGAVIGAIAGGGPGAAIGAGAGAAAGLGTSAASGGSQAWIPAEAVLTFHLTQQAPVVTVSQAEMDRLGYGVQTGSQQLQRRPPPPQQYPYYYGPVYYPRSYYRPY